MKIKNNSNTGDAHIAHHMVQHDDCVSLLQIIMSMHDELVLDVFEGDLVEVAHTLRGVMESTMSNSRVPMPVRCKVGKSLGTMSDYTDNG